MTYYFALAEAQFCRQARLFQHILSQGIGLENAILHEGARNLPITCYLIKSGLRAHMHYYERARSWRMTRKIQVFLTYIKRSVRNTFFVT